MDQFGSPYFALLALGFAVGCAWAIRRGQDLGITRLAMVDVCIAAVVGGLLGGRALHVAVEPLPGDSISQQEHAKLQELVEASPPAELPDPELKAALTAALAAGDVRAPWNFIANMPPGATRTEAIESALRDPESVPARLWYRARPLEALQFWKGGLAYVGGLGFGFFLGFLVVLRYGASPYDVADVTAPAIILGLGFGRLGCFLGGCCYGRICEAEWWSAQPKWYVPPVGGVARYPTALLSAGFAFALFLALRWLLTRRKVRGELFPAMLALYMPGRFLIEALRADPRGGGLGLSTSQLVVLISGVPAAILWIGLRVLRPARLALPLDPPAAQPAEEDTHEQSA